MSRALLLSLALLLPSGAFSQAPAGAQVLNLSCVEALVAINQPNLAGVFSFVPEKDAPAAFADLVVHDRKALKKWIAKLEKDNKIGGVSPWDHEAAVFALQIYASPIAETIDKPGEFKDRLSMLVLAPVLTLEELTARRRKG